MARRPARPRRTTFCGCLFLGQRLGHREPGSSSARRRWPRAPTEIGTIPELLRVLSLKGALVTIDAAGCQKDFAEQIRRKEADFLLCVKGKSTGFSKAAVERVFDRAVRGRLRGGGARRPRGDQEEPWAASRSGTPR